jgi:hypothetical protein
MRRAAGYLAALLTGRAGPLFAYDALMLQVGTKRREFDR